MLTSNRDPIEWLAVMADPLLAQSAVDRLKSAAWELVIEGESYRQRQTTSITQPDTLDRPPTGPRHHNADRGLEPAARTVGFGDGVDGTAIALRAAVRARSDESTNLCHLPESARTDDSSARNAFPSRPSCANRCRDLLKRGQFDRSCSFVGLVLVRRRLASHSTLDITGM